MKKRLKTWWVRRPRPRRGHRLVLNLALSAVLLTWLWGMAGYPLPTTEMEFRRLERTNLLERSRLVFSTLEFGQSDLAISGTHRTVTALDGTELTLNGHWFVGVTEGRAVVAFVRQRGYDGYNQWVGSFPLGEGPVLLPLSNKNVGWDAYGYWVAERETEVGYRYDYHNFLPLILLNAPVETVRVEVEVQADGGVCSGVGWRMEGNVWLLGLEKGQGDVLLYQGPSYLLSLYDQHDGLILEQTGCIPKAE